MEKLKTNINKKLALLRRQDLEINYSYYSNSKDDKTNFFSVTNQRLDLAIQDLYDLKKLVL